MLLYRGKSLPMPSGAVSAFLSFAFFDVVGKDLEQKAIMPAQIVERCCGLVYLELFVPMFLAGSIGIIYVFKPIQNY